MWKYEAATISQANYHRPTWRNRTDEYRTPHCNSRRGTLVEKHWRNQQNTLTNFGLWKTARFRQSRHNDVPNGQNTTVASWRYSPIPVLVSSVARILQILIMRSGRAPCMEYETTARLLPPQKVATNIHIPSKIRIHDSVCIRTKTARLLGWAMVAINCFKHTADN